MRRAPFKGRLDRPRRCRHIMAVLTKTLDESSNRISFSLIIAGLVVASSVLVPQSGWLQSIGIAGYGIAAVLGIWLIISILRSGRL